MLRGAHRTGIAAVVAVLCLTFAAAAALAWRQPTVSERQAITRAAKRSSTTANKTVHVSRIRVSTVGPWASATVTIYFGSMPDAATAILHRVHGKWINAGVGTAGEECVMPLKDRRNLGFGSYPCRK